MASAGLRLPSTGSLNPNPMMNPAMYQAQLAAALVAQRGHLSMPPHGIPYPYEGMEGFYPQQYDPISQVSLIFVL